MLFLMHYKKLFQKREWFTKILQLYRESGVHLDYHITWKPMVCTLFTDVRLQLHRDLNLQTKIYKCGKSQVMATAWLLEEIILFMQYAEISTLILFFLTMKYTV